MISSEHVFAAIRERLATKPMTRFVAFGSSNTERAGHCDGRYNWFDWFDVLVHEQYGRVHHIINSGVGGQNVHHLLDRVERDALAYAPDVVFVTIGGNDSGLFSGIDEDDFRASLSQLVDILKAQGCLVVLQTYYSPDAEEIIDTDERGEERCQRFYAYMDCVRKVAADKDVALIDHLARWELLRKADVTVYRGLMRDVFHMSPDGHKLFALDILRSVFGGAAECPFADDLAAARGLQIRIDGLGGASTPDVGLVDEWMGFKRHSFRFARRNACVVRPEKPLPGNPWIWRARFFGAFPPVDIELLRRGYHVAHVDVANLYGAPTHILPLWDAFYEYLTSEWNLAGKVVLEGFSRGGLPIYNWASARPDKVSCLYADAPVCDIRSWPAGRGRGNGSPDDWKRCRAVYGLGEDQAADFSANPIDLLKPIVEAGIPIIHVCGDVDEAVPIEENTYVLKQRLEDLGGSMKLIVKEGCAHHPHSLDPPDEIVEFIMQHSAL